MIALHCTNCGKSFKRRLAEYKRSNKATGNHFCTSSCQSSYCNTHQRKGKGEFYRSAHLDPSNRKDRLSPFRWFLARCRYRRTKWDCDLTLDYLVALWERQGGRCPFTGWKLTLPRNSSGFAEKSMRNASLDRIDSSQGYVKGNVQFVALPVNLAKGDFTNAEMMEFFAAVQSFR